MNISGGILFVIFVLKYSNIYYTLVKGHSGRFYIYNNGQNRFLTPWYIYHPWRHKHLTGVNERIHFKEKDFTSSYWCVLSDGQVSSYRDVEKEVYLILYVWRVYFYPILIFFPGKILAIKFAQFWFLFAGEKKSSFDIDVTYFVIKYYQLVWTCILIWLQSTHYLNTDTKKNTTAGVIMSL